ncbi:helix-turn-helix domain-containing protein [Sphingomonas alpina]|uniref:MerR family transcriptional regulator n=1 Tax=Sphingomonas alpina TaxID=653931 RepID=A0A7H0LFH5_9SPHN|nr:MerR family transcriptional regulator [Sphingomonas alpina]QNQ08428.1 MerR family transcriptional regulator [Sphingomonas alpina]
MGVKLYTIGELASLTGQSVRRIRFYSDKGLLPPNIRSASNYRLYADADVARLDLIRALRDAGVGLAAIEKLLRSRLSLRDVLRTRLDILETEILAKRRTAAVLRATLRVPDPAANDLRRLWTMSRLSNAQMRTLVETFVDRIAEGAPIDDDWRERMMETSVPDLPDDPTEEQIAAWEEIATLLEDEGFAQELRAETSAFWTDALDPAAYQDASLKTYEVVTRAVDQDLAPDSAEGRAIAQEWLRTSARAMGRTPDRAFIDWHIAQYDKLSGRMGRYRELLAQLRGETVTKAESRAWSWLNDAMKAAVPA